MPHVYVYTVERIGITEEGNLGVTIEEMTFDAMEAFEKCEARKNSEGVAYGVTKIVLEVENPPDDAEIVRCHCWNEGQYGRVHREGCPIHKNEGK